MTAPDIRILHIQHDDCTALMIGHALTREFGQDLTVDRAVSLCEAIRMLDDRHYDAVLFDLNVPDADNAGQDVSRLKPARSRSVVLLTDNGDNAQRAAALSSGADAVLAKSGISVRTLTEAIRPILDQVLARRIRRHQIDQTEGFYKHFINVAEDAFILIGERGNILTRNAAADRLWTAYNIGEYEAPLCRIDDNTRHLAMMLKFDTGLEVHDVLITPVVHDGVRLHMATIRNLTPQQADLSKTDETGPDLVDEIRIPVSVKTADLAE